MTTKRELLHQMRWWPPVWARPMDDRPPYIVWPVATVIVAGAWCALLSWPHPDIWKFYGGFCVGVLGASIAHYLYRR